MFYAASSLIILSSFCFGQAAPDAIPSFDHILSSAYAQSLDAKRALSIQHQNETQVDLAKYGNYPRFGITGTAYDQRPTPVSSGSVKNQNYAASLTYTLYDFGRTARKVEIADNVREQSALGVIEANETLRWKVARGYLALVSAASVFAIAGQNQNVAQAKAASIRQDYQRGLRSESDSVTAQADYLNAKLNHERARSDVVVAWRQVQAISGLSNLTPNIAAPSVALYAKKPQVWEQLVQTWNELRPTSTQLRRKVEHAGLALQEDAVRANNRPVLEAQIGAQNAGTWKVTKNLYYGQVQLRWELPWFGRERKDIEAIGFQRESVDYDEAIEIKARADTEALALAHFAQFKGLWDAADEQLKARERQYQLSKKRYDAGQASLLELSASELEMGNARLDQVRVANSLVDAVLSLAEVRNIEDPGVIFR